MVAAYIDPSSMTYLIQIGAGILIAAGAGIGFYWKQIRRKLFGKKHGAAENASVSEEAIEGTGETITAEMLRAQAQTDNNPNREE